MMNSDKESLDKPKSKRRRIVSSRDLSAEDNPIGRRKYTRRPTTPGKLFETWMKLYNQFKESNPQSAISKMTPDELQRQMFEYAQSHATKMSDESVFDIANFSASFRNKSNFEQIVQRWLAFRRSKVGVEGIGIAPSTHVQDVRTMNFYILPHFGSLRIEDITVEMLSKFFISLVRDKKLAPQSVRNIANVLSMCFHDSMLRHWVELPFNPMHHDIVRESIPSNTVRRNKVWNYLDRESFFKLIECEAVPKDCRVWYSIAGLAGLDMGEIAGLQWGDIHLQSKPPYLEVNRACPSCKLNDWVQLGPPKRPSRYRQVPLHPICVKAIEDWKDELSSVTDEELGSEYPLLPSPMGKHWRPEMSKKIRKHLELVCGKGYDHIDLKSLRRSFATWLHETEVDDSVIVRLMGHTDRSVTMKHYTSPMLSRAYQAVCKIGKS